MVKLNLPKERKYIVPCPIWKRLFAFVIDLLLIDLIIASPFRKLFSSVFGQADYYQALDILYGSPGKMSVMIVSTGIITGLSLLYFTVLEWKIQQTLGKILMNIYIKPVKKKLTFWNVALSNITFIPFFPFIVLWVIDPIHIFLSPKNQRLMEKFTGIMVVENQIMWQNG